MKPGHLETSNNKHLEEALRTTWQSPRGVASWRPHASRHNAID